MGWRQKSRASGLNLSRVLAPARELCFHVDVRSGPRSQTNPPQGLLGLSFPKHRRATVLTGPWGPTWSGSFPGGLLSSPLDSPPVAIKAILPSLEHPSVFLPQSLCRVWRVTSCSLKSRCWSLNPKYLSVTSQTNERSSQSWWRSSELIRMDPTLTGQLSPYKGQI